MSLTGQVKREGEGEGERQRGRGGERADDRRSRVQTVSDHLLERQTQLHQDKLAGRNSGVVWFDGKQ